MILVDKQIREQIRYNNLISKYADSGVFAIGYDLRASQFIQKIDGEEKQFSKYTLLPGDSVFVATIEDIKMPSNIVGRIINKNSRIRQGITIDAPMYQPGHHTKIFVRMTNISKDSIELVEKKSYFSILFEFLNENPEATYSGTFQEEFDYTGLAEYTTEYTKELGKVQASIDEFKEKEKALYANVMTIMSIFIAIFSVINVNLNFAEAKNTIDLMVSVNLVLLGSISALGAIVAYIVNSKKGKWLWLVSIIFFFLTMVLSTGFFDLLILWCKARM